MLENQIRGLIAIVLILAIIPLIIFYSNSTNNYSLPDSINKSSNSATIELSVGQISKGIYFTAPGTTANQLLQQAGFIIRTDNDFPLQDGMKINIDANDSRKISLASIDNCRRLAMGMPIDLNKASEDDLLLIPGIGVKTAQRILDLKKEKEHFKKIEELMEIKGIKDKKLAKIKQYLYVKM